MQSMRAFKSLKAFFSDGLVSNVWLHHCKTSEARIVYVCGFVQHSLTMHLPCSIETILLRTEMLATCAAFVSNVCIPLELTTVQHG